MPKKNNADVVTIRQFSGYFLMTCIVISFLLMFWLFRPFFTVLVLAAVLATTFYPLYMWFLRLMRNRARLASFTTCFLVLVLIVIPLIILVFLLARQAVDIYHFVESKVASGEIDRYLQWQKGNFFYDLFDPNAGQLGAYIDLRSFDIKQNLTDLARNVSGFLVNESASILRGVGGLILNFIILLFVMYYFFMDHKAITNRLMKISPLPLEHEMRLFQKFKEISRTTLYGIFFVSIAKGLLGGIGFAIAGIPNPVFWGTVMAFFSLVPVFGATLIWLPAAILLIMNGQMFQGIFLLLWGTLFISTIDNIFSALFIGNRVKLNPMLVFLSVLGGIGLFGLVGIIFGPLILTIFLTFLHIYELEYKEILHH